MAKNRWQAISTIMGSQAGVQPGCLDPQRSVMVAYRSWCSEGKDRQGVFVLRREGVFLDSNIFKRKSRTSEQKPVSLHNGNNGLSPAS